MITNSLIRTTLKHDAILMTVPEEATSPDTRHEIGRVRSSDAYAPLSGIYAVQKQYRERAGGAQLAQARTIYVSNEYEIESDMRLKVLHRKGRSKEYRIRDVTGWPDGTPQYYELLVESE